MVSFTGIASELAKSRLDGSEQESAATRKEKREGGREGRSFLEASPRGQDEEGGAQDCHHVCTWMWTVRIRILCDFQL